MIIKLSQIGIMLGGYLPLHGMKQKIEAIILKIHSMRTHILVQNNMLHTSLSSFLK